MKKGIKHTSPLPVIAAAVVIVAAGVIFMPKKTGSQTSPSPASTVSAGAGGLVIQDGDVGITASYFDYDADGTTVEMFAVQAPDGTIRLALNTCQVCNGSPYAYFEQNEDTFTCQNCGNRFSSAEIGIAGGGCRPIPITDGVYTQQDGAILIPDSFLKESAVLFKNWKNF